MGLSHFPAVSEGILPLLVMNTALSVSVLKNMVRSIFQAMGAFDIDESPDLEDDPAEDFTRNRRIAVTQFKALCQNRGTCSRDSSSSTNILSGVECCVCLCGFKEEEEVSELSCKHFFHRGCLDKWLGNRHTSCPLCRSSV